MTTPNSAPAMGMAVHEPHAHNKSAENKTQGKQKPLPHNQSPLSSAEELLADSNAFPELHPHSPRLKKTSVVFQIDYSNRVNSYWQEMILIKDCNGKAYRVDAWRNTVQVITHYPRAASKWHGSLLYERLSYSSSRQQASLTLEPTSRFTPLVSSNPEQGQVNIQQERQVAPNPSTISHCFAGLWA